jgi:hypothetical protein
MLFCYMLPPFFPLTLSLPRTRCCPSSKTQIRLYNVSSRFCSHAGKPTAKVIEEIADVYAFIGDQTKTPCKRD